MRIPWLCCAPVNSSCLSSMGPDIPISAECVDRSIYDEHLTKVHHFHLACIQLWRSVLCSTFQATLSLPPPLSLSCPERKKLRCLQPAFQEQCIQHFCDSGSSLTSHRFPIFIRNCFTSTWRNLSPNIFISFVYAASLHWPPPISLHCSRPSKPLSFAWPLGLLILIL